ncbi:asparaginase [Phyllobacterium sp. SB3]|uniref:asparaginase n=1 Tax=Phyllobacterium sp. SB3 TaxID=3156073 RepID=UPI0032AF44A7
MKKIVLITTGGTIASRHDPRTGDSIAIVGGDELRSSLHGEIKEIDLEVEEFSNIGSYSFDLPHAFRLAQRIQVHLNRDDCTGVVVTHGTDTMEESAYLADLTVISDKPVVFTGAQRSADIPDADGPRNIEDAIRLAASEKARGLGTMIVFEQEFHAARDATKSHASRTDTFGSAEHGKLGEVDGDEIIVSRKPVLRKTYKVKNLVSEIELIKLAMGTTDSYLRFAATSGARAIIIEAFGRGNATPSVARAIPEIVSYGLPVIITSRCTKGRVKPVYGNGGGRDLERGGAIFAGDLSGPKARILVSVLLGAGLKTDEIAREIRLLAG